MALRKTQKVTTTNGSLPADSIVTLSQLETHLWEASNILRGPVYAADFKIYVLPLQLFKRVSDAHDEEYQAALAKSRDDEEYASFPQNYRFQMPYDCHLDGVRDVSNFEPKVDTGTGSTHKIAIYGKDTQAKQSKKRT